MSIVKIDYSALNAAYKRAEDVEKLFYSCDDSIEKKVSKSIQNIPGTDSFKHISEATRIVIEKRKVLEERSKIFSDIARNIDNMRDNLEQHDINAQNSVNNIANAAFGLNNRKPLRKVADWLYGVFCVEMTNWNPITRWVGDKIKSFNDWISNKANKVFEWFKHGAGRYWLNIGSSIITDIAAIFASVRAVMLATATTVATGGVAAPLLIAAIASCVGTVMTVVDSFEVIQNNIRALKIDEENEDPGRARYYGNIDGVKEATKRYDYGGKMANGAVEGAGIAYDVTHTVADITAFVSGTFGAAGLEETGLKGVDGKYTGRREYKWSSDTAKSRLKEGFKQKLGFETTNGQTKWSAKNLFKTEPKTGALHKDKMYSKHALNDTFGREHVKAFETAEKSVKIVDKGLSHIEKFDTIFGHGYSAKDRIESTAGILKDTPLRFSYIIKDISKLKI